MGGVWWISVIVESKQTRFLKKVIIRQYHIQIFDKIFFFKYTCIGQDKSKLQKQIRKLFILIETAACFCILICLSLILEKDNFIKHLYIVLS